ncbi:MAG: accessory gene regulator B family protein [Clostridia bacterium]|nr:accessory gene regulator B family protein [Clostridia bacterium]
MEKKGILSKLARFLAHETGKDQEVLLYALLLVKTSILSYTLLFLFSWVLGVWQWAFAAALTAAIFRVFSGGAHASHPIRCSIIGATVFTTVGALVATFYIPVGNYQFGMILLVVFVISSVIFYIYVPADTPGKPITSQVQRTYLRIISYSLLVVWSAAVYFLFISARDVFAESLIIASLGGLCWQVFTLTPPGYLVFDRFDTFLKLLWKGG